MVLGLNYRIKGRKWGRKMKKHLNLKSYVNLKKGVLIFSELLVLLLILGSAMVMTDTGLSDQNKSSDVQNSVENPTVNSLGPGLAPENPEFTNYQKNKVSAQNEPSLAGHKWGYIPSPVNLHNVGHVSTSRSLSAPLYYDLRALNKVTPVKDQGMTGSCWAFATYASLESYFKPAENLDFSENNLKNVLSSTYSDGFDFTEGGNMFMSTAYLARWGGPVAESDDPYSDSSTYSPTGLPVQKHVQDVSFLSDRRSPLDNQEIKSAVQTYGAVYTTMCYDNAYYSPATSSYYYDGSDYSNHAVAIVGWNDSFDRNKFNRVPPGDGAFIIKNSWGTGWGDQGYFYVSYYDSNIGTENGVFTAESVNNYKNIYQYDPLGWVVNYGYGNPTWCANIFTAKSSEVLKAVSFYTTDVNCNYGIYIYTNPKSNPINQATLALTQNGVIPNAGYHTVSLSSGVPLQAGQKFSVVLKLTNPGSSNPIALEYPYSGYSSKATAHAGESFVSADGNTWTDMTTIYRNTNVCIKAFTDTAEEVPPVANFSATPLSGVTSLQVTFTDGSTGSPTSWYWDFGDGTNSTQQNPKHTYSAVGVYMVTLTASNTAGSKTITKPSYITVTAAQQKPTASFNSNVTSGIASLSVRFNDTSTGAPNAWSWNFGDGQTSRVASPTHTYTKAGTYTVTLTVQNTAGSSTTAKSGYIRVAVPPKPVAAFSGSPISGTMPLTVQFTDTSAKSPASWRWTFGDGQTSTQQNPTHTYSKVGKYTVTLTATNTAGSNTVTKSGYINVMVPPKAPFAAFSASTTSGKAPLKVTFTDKSTNAPTLWAWNFGDGTSSTVKNPVHTYSKAGRYTVTLTAANSAGSKTLVRTYYITAR